MHRPPKQSPLRRLAKQPRTYHDQDHHFHIPRRQHPATSPPPSTDPSPPRCQRRRRDQSTARVANVPCQRLSAAISSHPDHPDMRDPTLASSSSKPRQIEPYSCWLAKVPGRRPSRPCASSSARDGFTAGCRGIPVRLSSAPPCAMRSRSARAVRRDRWRRARRGPAGSACRRGPARRTSPAPRRSARLGPPWGSRTRAGPIGRQGREHDPADLEIDLIPYQGRISTRQRQYRCAHVFSTHTGGSRSRSDAILAPQAPAELFRPCSENSRQRPGTTGNNHEPTQPAVKEVDAGQSEFSQVVAGVGFEPT
jgi:hypothetical protein